MAFKKPVIRNSARNKLLFARYIACFILSLLCELFALGSAFYVLIMQMLLMVEAEVTAVIYVHNSLWWTFGVFALVPALAFAIRGDNLLHKLEIIDKE